MYSAYGLLRPENDFSLEAAEARVRAFAPQAVTTRKGQDFLTLSINGWDLNFRINDGPEVLTESHGFAGKIAGLEPGSGLEECARRVEVWTDTPDPFLEHFEKYQQVIAVLRSFKGVIALDPKEPALL